MSTSYYADRINLYWLMHEHPDWTQQEYADAIGRSKSWVGEWQGRLRSVPRGDILALHQIAQGFSRARKNPPARIDPQIEAEILSIRDEPKDGATAHARATGNPVLLTSTYHVVAKRPAASNLNTYHL